MRDAEVVWAMSASLASCAAPATASIVTHDFTSRATWKTWN